MVLRTRLHVFLPTPILKSAACLQNLFFYGQKQPTKLTSSKQRACNSAGECYLHTVEVVGSNPIAPIRAKSSIIKDLALLFYPLPRRKTLKSAIKSAKIVEDHHNEPLLKKPDKTPVYLLVHAFSRLRFFAAQCPSARQKSLVFHNPCRNILFRLFQGQKVYYVYFSVKKQTKKYIPISPKKFKFCYIFIARFLIFSAVFLL